MTKQFNLFAILIILNYCKAQYDIKNIENIGNNNNNNNNDFTTTSIYNVNRIQVKIVQEPINFELADSNQLINRQQQNQQLSVSNELKSPFKPAQYAGPPQFEELIGKCFSFLNKNYKWIVCPFKNVTQFEQNMRWNPYKGILGVWLEWEINESNNKFIGMKMMNGDECGASLGRRSSKVILNCNRLTNTTEITHVSEPTTCKYIIEMKTPLACEHELDYSMNVYAHLNQELKSKWNKVLSEFKDGIITEKMYNLSLKKIFKEAGFQHDENYAEKNLLYNNETSATVAAVVSLNHLSRHELEEKLNKCEYVTKLIRNK